MIVAVTVLVVGGLTYSRQKFVPDTPSFFRELRISLSFVQVADCWAAGVGSGTATPSTLVAAMRTSLRASMMEVF